MRACAATVVNDGGGAFCAVRLRLFERLCVCVCVWRTQRLQYLKPASLLLGVLRPSRDSGVEQNAPRG